jgi:phosphohistidine phosphatase SixA
MSLRHDEPAGAHFEGLHYEAAAVARAVAAGHSETPQRLLSSYIRTMEAADEIRRQLGIEFPYLQTLPAKATVA